ncbi:MAG: hypothetical protein J0L51_07240 [Rhizobiales bacterium]|nr:hypothetical protein [Hyphomicrobiales bacterium]
MTALPLTIDIAPIVKRSAPLEEPQEFRVGDPVRVRFEDWLGIHAPHELDGEVVALMLNDRLKVRIGNTHFSVPADACTKIGRV